MAKVKFEVIRDFDGNVDGYKLGNWYLMKHYFWDNEFSWILNKDGRCVYSSYEYSKKYDAGEIIPVLSCREGKQRLIELNEMSA